MHITSTVTSNNPNTIYGKLKAKLGREPSNKELKEEIHRILSEAAIDMASKGKLPHQRKA